MPALQRKAESLEADLTHGNQRLEELQAEYALLEHELQVRLDNWYCSHLSVLGCLRGLGNGCSADEDHGGLTSCSSVLLPSYVNTEDGTAQSPPWSCILPFTAFGGKVPSLIMQQVIMRGSEWSSNNKMKISCLRLSCDHPVDSKELRIENYS